MNAVLKNRQMQIPNGFQFRLPEIGYQAPPFQSFDSLVANVLRVVLANPRAAQKNNWPTTQQDVANWVDRTNAEICVRNGWKDYVTISSVALPPPKFPAPATIARLQAVAGAVKKLTRGVSALLDWETSGSQPVALVVAEGRAAICTACPQNGRGELTSWFTVPAAEKIRFHMERIHSLKLSTSQDAKLGVCESCLCPLKLKVWTPESLVKKHLTDDIKNDLPSNCWMLK